VLDDVVHFRHMEIRKDWDDDSSHHRDGEIGYAPLRLVFAEESNPVASDDSTAVQEMRNSLDVIEESCIGVDLSVDSRQSRLVSECSCAPLEESAQSKFFQGRHILPFSSWSLSESL
jgi:hypothetical protein